MPRGERCWLPGARPRRSTAIVVGLVGRVFGVADALLDFPLDLLHAPLDLLARVVGRIAECTLRLPGDVLQLSLRLITIHEVDLLLACSVRWLPSVYMKGKGMS
jgi:hypothetical protein